MAETKCKRGFQSHVMCDCEPTHPLTPREKVAGIVLDVAAAYLIQQYGASHGLDHETDRARIMSSIPHDAILTALASGSGDHAELARLAEEACAPMSTKTVGMHLDAMAKFNLAANPATVLALLAEIAALNDYGKSVAKEALAYRNQATEAERKLAEAVAVIRDVDRAARQAASMNDAGYTVTVERTATHIYGITDTFLSKEAERG